MKLQGGRSSVAATPARVDAADIARALESESEIESLAHASEPLATFLRRAGAFYRATYEEIDLTDWNGAVVGRGDGAMLRAPIARRADLTSSALARLLEHGLAPQIVAALCDNPMTPESALAHLASAPLDYERPHGPTSRSNGSICSRRTRRPSAARRARPSSEGGSVTARSRGARSRRST